jgi:hypothetical protein
MSNNTPIGFPGSVPPTEVARLALTNTFTEHQIFAESTNPGLFLDNTDLMRKVLVYSGPDGSDPFYEVLFTDTTTPGSLGTTRVGMRITDKGNAELFFNGAQKFNTTNVGVAVTGTLTATTGIFSGTLTANEVVTTSGFSSTGSITSTDGAGNLNALNTGYQNIQGTSQDPGIFFERDGVTRNALMWHLDAGSGVAMTRIGHVTGNAPGTLTDVKRSIQFKDNAETILCYNDVDTFQTDADGTTTVGVGRFEGIGSPAVFFDADDNVRNSFIWVDDVLGTLNTNLSFCTGNTVGGLTNIKNFLNAEDGGATLLLYDGSPKFQTTATGVSVTGNLFANGDVTCDEITSNILTTQSDGTTTQGLARLEGIANPGLVLNTTANARNTFYEVDDNAGTLEAHFSFATGDTDGGFSALSKFLTARDGEKTFLYYNGTEKLSIDSDGFTSQGIGRFEGIGSPGIVLNSDDNARNVLHWCDDNAGTLVAIHSHVTGEIAGGFSSVENYLSATDGAGTALHFNGTQKATTVTNGWEVTGDVRYTGSLVDISDIRVKKDIKHISNATDTLKKINGYTFKKFSDPRITGGVIAQEVLDAFPEASVIWDDGSSDPLLAVDENCLTGLMVAAINELTKKVEALTNGN